MRKKNIFGPDQQPAFEDTLKLITGINEMYRCDALRKYDASNGGLSSAFERDLKDRSWVPIFIAFRFQNVQETKTVLEISSF